MTKERRPEDFAREMSSRIGDVAAGMAFDRWVSFSALCESPIESVFAAAIVEECSKPPPCPYRLWTTSYKGSPEQLPTGIHFFPQTVIGKHRLDFLVVVVGRRPNKLQQTALFAIECDGHDFHEKTKEQAARDKRRDRILAAADVRVIRFTDSEIWRSPNDCFRELVDIILGTMGWRINP